MKIILHQATDFCRQENSGKRYLQRNCPGNSKCGVNGGDWKNNQLISYIHIYQAVLITNLKRAWAAMQARCTFVKDYVPRSMIE